MTEPRHLVLDLAATSRNWAITSDREQQLKAGAPEGWVIDVVDAPTSSDGDGPPTASDAALRLIPNAEVYFGFGITRDLLEAGKKLRWVHSAAAGVASLMNAGIGDTDIIVTNSAGLHGPPIAEFVVAAVLYFMRGLDVAIAQQRQSTWNKQFFVAEDSPLREVSGARVLVVGAGGLGRESAMRLSALGATCIGLRRRPELGIPQGFQSVAGLDALERELPLADVVLLSAPLTAETSHVMTRGRLALLHPRAILVNVARGALVDEDALADRLEAGALRGAALDVFQKEPLPVESRLWQLPNVLIAPHVSPVSPGRFWPRQLELFLDNWQRYAAGQPLRNLVDKQAGY